MKFVAKYYGMTLKEVEKRGESALIKFEKVWNKKKRKTSKDIREAYNETSEMLFRFAWSGQLRDYSKIRKLIKKKDKLLDYGCGVATPFETFIDKGYNITLADIKSPTFKFVKWKYGTSAKYILIKEKLSLKEKYNFIVCTDVLEHVTNPISLLNHLLSHLNKQGYLLFYFSTDEDKVSHLTKSIKKHKRVESIINRKLKYVDSINGGQQIYIKK